MRLSTPKRALVAVCLLGMQPACGGEDVVILTGANPPEEPALPDPVAPAPSGPTLAQIQSDDASWVFDEDAMHRYELTLTAEDWEALQATALEEQYFPATLQVDGVTFGEVGFRFKGANSTLRRCRDGAGTPICPKMSFKVKFDEYDDSQRFFGLKRLNFNSMLGDPSWLHERLAYQLFREMGVAAPRATHARLIVNGEDRGVFSQVEQIDGRFTDDRFAGGDGNLYKEQWPITTNPGPLNRTLETNEESANHELMINLSRELATATPEQLPLVVARYWDPDELFAYLAVDRAITNWDGVTGYHCRRSGSGCFNHNYYVYQHEREPRFSLIPWDLDNTFRVITPFDVSPMPLQIPADCSIRYPVFWPSGFAAAPACDPMFQGLARMDRNRYTAQIERLLQGPFALDRLQAWIDARVAQLIPHVMTDSYGPGEVVFQLAVQTLRADLPALAERVWSERDGTLEAFRLTADAPNDFETTDPLSLQLGVERQTGIHGLLLPSLERTAALGGQHSLLLTFRIGLERDGVIPWSRVRLVFPTPTVDLTGKSGLRLKIQAESRRVVRIALDSGGYSQPGSELVLGWDVPVDTVAREIELPFSTASFPPGAPEMPETPTDVLSSVLGLLLHLEPVERHNPVSGHLHAADAGRIRIDDIEFLP